jgi:hypothetical protein
MRLYKWVGGDPCGLASLKTDGPDVSFYREQERVIMYRWVLIIAIGACTH